MMTSRERVETSLNHEEPDRIPITVNTITDREYKKLCQFLGIKKEVRHSPLSHDAIIDEKILKRLHVDVRGIGINTMVKHLSNGIVEDWWGVKWKDTGHMFMPMDPPLKKAQNIDEIENYPWPDPNDPSLIKGKYKQAKELYQRTNYALIAWSGGMLFHRYSFLRGLEQWLLDMKLNPELYRAIADKILEISLTATLNLLNEVGDYVIMVALADDMGTQKAPFISVKDYRKFVKPWFKRYIQAIKRSFPRIKIYYHCHGAVYPLIPDFIDCGVEILNPILPKAKGMQPERLKNEFGDQLSFHGGIDIQETIPFGTVNEVREHVKKVIDVLAPGGGYMFVLQNIRENTPQENIIVAYDTAFKYGKYPITQRR